MARNKARRLVGAAILTAMALPPVAAQAQSANADQQMSFSIPAQRLSDALRQLAAASGLQLVYDTKITDGKMSPGVSGAMSSRAALAAVLAGSGLSFQFSGDRTVIITAVASGSASASEDGVRAVGVVSVEGGNGNMPFGSLVSPVNGTNGSRDVEATEGTGSYTTGATSIVSKIPQTLKDTPQTVSVATSQRIEDQNLTSVRDILQNLPGITTAPGATNEEFNVYSRGFRITTYSYDGGAPVTYDLNARPMLNMAEFDSVQLARGATGLFGGYGDPGGMVNLVRKKPLDHEQFTFDLDAGSWRNFREVIDYTGPLTADKRLRGRIVGSHQSKDYFYDIANSEKTGIYGVLEYDLTPKTLVTVGVSGNWENSVLNTTGLPRYASGKPINWPISTCLCAPGGGERAKKLSAFATISQQIGDKWQLKINAMYDYQFIDDKIVQITADYPGIPDGATVAPGSASGYRAVNPVKQTAIDAALVGEFRLFGRTHTLAVGANYQYVKADGGFTSYYDNVSIPNLFTWDPYSYMIQNPTVKNYAAPYVRTSQYGIYGNLKLEIFKSLHASIGMRYSEILRKAIFTYDYTPDPDIIPNLRDRSHSRPNVGVTWDITKNLAAYGSYQSIYQPQIYARYLLNGAVPPPISGSNAEGGIKWQSPNKKVNASLAAFKIIQNGVLGADYSGPDPKVSPQVYDTRSKGIELELNGEVLPGWQVFASYTYNDNTFTQSSFYSPGTTVTPATSYTPKHLGKVWTTYRFTAGGALAGAILGAGVDVVSKSYQTTQFCNFDPVTSTFKCVPYNFVTKPYATFALKAGYQLSKNIELSVNVTNVTNYRTFVATNQQQITAYNYYLQPRAFLASMRFKW